MIDLVVTVASTELGEELDREGRNSYVITRVFRFEFEREADVQLALESLAKLAVHDEVLIAKEDR